MPGAVPRLFLLYMLVVSCGAPLTSKEDLVQSKAVRCPTGAVEPGRLEALAQEITTASGVMTAAATTSCARSSVSCQPVTATQGETVEYLFTIIAEELARYPAAFLAEHGPKRIWLVNHLKSETIGREASGIAVYSSRVIYLAIPTDCSDANFRRTVQHELFHTFEPRIVKGVLQENAWNAHNPPGFSYTGHSSHVSRDSKEGPPVGFPSWYAQTTAFEDRAESFAYSLVAPWSDAMPSRVTSDRFLAGKLSTLRGWLGMEWPELSGFLENFPQ